MKNLVIPWTHTFNDRDGVSWVFNYTGGSVVRIRPGSAAPTHWTNSISLDSYGLKPENINRAWLIRRGREWIKDRNADLDSGLYD